MRQESCVWTARISARHRVEASKSGSPPSCLVEPRSRCRVTRQHRASSLLGLSKIPSRPSHRPSRRRLRSTMLRPPAAHSLEPAQRTPFRIRDPSREISARLTPSSKSFAGILTSTKPTQPDASRCIVNQDESSDLCAELERHHEEQRDKGKTKRSPSVPSFSASEHHRRFGEYRSAGKSVHAVHVCDHQRGNVHRSSYRDSPHQGSALDLSHCPVGQKVPVHRC